MNKSFFHFLVSLFLCLSLNSATVRAQFGELDDIVWMALSDDSDDFDLPYIAELMGAFSNKLRVFAESKKIDSPKERLAFFLTMHLLNNFFSEATYDASELACQVFWGRTFAKDSGLYIAADATKRLEMTNRITLDAALNAIKKVVGITNQSNPLVLGATMVAQGARPRHLLSLWSVEKMNFLVAQWMTLNYFVDKAEVLLDAAFPVILSGLRDGDVATRHFRTSGRWNAFRAHNFGRLGTNAEIFTNPWLTLLNEWIVRASSPRFNLALSLMKSKERRASEQLRRLLENWPELFDERDADGYDLLAFANREATERAKIIVVELARNQSKSIFIRAFGAVRGGSY